MLTWRRRSKGGFGELNQYFFKTQAVITGSVSPATRVVIRWIQQTSPMVQTTRSTASTVTRMFTARKPWPSLCLLIQHPSQGTETLEAVQGKVNIFITFSKCGQMFTWHSSLIMLHKWRHFYRLQSFWKRLANLCWIHEIWKFPKLLFLSQKEVGC